MRKIILLIVVVGIIAAGWFIYFNQGEPDSHITVYTAEKKDLRNMLEFSGEVKPSRTFRVMSATGGIIKSVYVDEGDKVSAGQTLIALDTAEIDAQIDRAELAIQFLEDSIAQNVMATSDPAKIALDALAGEKAKIALALSQTTGFDYESFNNAFSEDVAEQAAQAAASMEAMRMEDIAAYLPEELNLPGGEISQGHIEIAQLAVDALKRARSRMSMTSRISGTVVSMTVGKGEVLAPGMPAVIIADTENVKIEAYVYEKDVDALSEGMDIIVATDSGRTIGTLTDIGKAASGATNSQLPGAMTTLTIEPSNAFSRMPGAIVDLEVVLSEKTDCLVLPHSCITKDKHVFVIDEEGVAAKRAVKTGFSNTTSIEITSGLSEGEIVALSPKDLTEGQRVTYDRSE